MVGDGGEGGDEDGRNGVDVGDALQGSISDGAAIWEQYLGGDGGHVKSTRGITSLGR